MSVKILAVGKVKESYLQAGILEYAKRLQPFVTFTIQEVKESNTQDIARDLEQEGGNSFNN
jgi:23S rRNA (pseudouridine1915-N3)-methyltransferase